MKSFGLLVFDLSDLFVVLSIFHRVIAFDVNWSGTSTTLIESFQSFVILANSLAMYTLLSCHFWTRLVLFNVLIIELFFPHTTLPHTE